MRDDDIDEIKSETIVHSIVETLLDQRKNKVERGFYWENQIAFAYNSNKIEGGKLSADQTRYIFETRTIVSDQGNPTPVDDVIETLNHFRLFDFMLDTLDKPLTSDLIKSFQGVLTEGNTASKEDPNYVSGDWKNTPNRVGDLVQTVAPKNVDSEVHRLIKSYSRKEPKDYRDIVGFHVFFERIHPFSDGNGRVGRIIMYRECIRNGLVPFIVPDKFKGDYYACIRTFGKNPELFEKYAERMARLYVDEFGSLVPAYSLINDGSGKDRISDIANRFFQGATTQLPRSISAFYPDRTEVDERSIR